MAARRWLGLVTQLTWLAGLEPSAARVDCRRAPARPDRSLDANAGTPSAAVAAPTLDVSAGSQQQQPSAAAAAGSYRAKASQRRAPLLVSPRCESQTRGRGQFYIEIWGSHQVLSTRRLGRSDDIGGWTMPNFTNAPPPSSFTQ